MPGRCSSPLRRRCISCAQSPLCTDSIDLLVFAPQILTSAIWAGRNPGVPVNYNVNWTYGGDGSKPGGGYAAIHGWVSS